MTLDQDKLAALLSKQKTSKKIVAFFANATEAERKELAPFCLKWLKDQVKIQREKWKQWRTHELLDAANYAAYACCNFSALQPMRRWVEIEGELAFKLLSDRKPVWLDDWAQMRAEQGEDWNVIRRLVRDGLCKRPRHDNYTRDMIHSNPAAKEFMDDPGLLKEEFWRIFEVPDSMRNESFFGCLDARWHSVVVTLASKGVIARQDVFEHCFSALDMGFNRERVKFFFKVHDSLKPTLTEREGMLPAYCGMLEHSFPTVVQFGFDSLRLLDKQKKQDAGVLSEALRPLFRQPTKKMVKATLTWLGELLKREPAAATEIVLAATDGVGHEKADIQAEAWKFVAKHAPADDRIREQIQNVSELASPSVRKEIRQWLATQGGEHAASAEGAIATTVDLKQVLADPLKAAKKLKPGLRDLLGVSELLKVIEKRSTEIPGCRFDGTELARLADLPELTPIKDLPELLETAARVQEDGTQLDDGDRVIEALSRITVRGDTAAVKAAAPVIKRAGKLLEKSYYASFVGAGVHRELRALLLGWGCEDDEISKIQAKIADEEDSGLSPAEFLARPDEPFERAGFAGFLGLRSRQIFDLLRAQEPFCIVGAATHSGGWIDPRVLVRRAVAISKSGDKTAPYDLILSLLRLAPDYRGSALKLAEKNSSHLKSEYGSALIYALGGKRPKTMKSAELWIAAARARSPWSDDDAVEKKFPGRGPDAGRAAVYQPQMPSEYYAAGSPLPKPHQPYSIDQNVDWSLPTVVAHEHDRHCDFNFGLDTKPPEQAIIDQAATVWPLARESYYRVEAYDDLSVTLKPLFDPCTPLREMSTAALAVSLGSGYAEQRTLAVDVAICCIEDGRYDPNPIGRMLAQAVKQANRYVKSLPDVAAASPLHALQVAQSLIAMLANLPKKNLPSAFGGMLQVLLDLMEANNIKLEDQAAREFLQDLPGSGKAAKLAKRILTHQAAGDPDLAAIYDVALNGRMNCGRKLAP